MRIFGGDVGEFHGGAHQLLDTFARKIGSVGSARPAAHQNAQASAARTGFLQIFKLAHAHIGGEFFALGDRAFRVGGARSKRALTTSFARSKR